MTTKRIFWSYKSEERDFARKIVSDLRKAGFDVWWDQKGIQGGDEWPLILQKTLDDPNTAVLISQITPAYLASKWCMRELRRADGNKPTIPVLRATVPAMPIEYDGVHFFDFRDDTQYAVMLEALIAVLKKHITPGDPLPVEAPPLPEPGKEENPLTRMRLEKDLAELVDLYKEVEEDYRTNKNADDRHRLGIKLNNYETKIRVIAQRLGKKLDEIENMLRS